MATPHVAGLATYLLAINGYVEPEELCSYLAETATEGQIEDPGLDTVNLIAFNGNLDD